MPPRADSWSAAWCLGEAARAGDALDSWERAQSSPFAHVFHRPALLRMWIDTIGAASEAMSALVALTHRDGTVGRLAAVVTRHRGSMSTRLVLEPIGQDLFGYHDPLFDAAPPEGSLDAFWSAVRDSAPACDQALFRFVAQALAPERFRVPSADQSPVLMLGADPSLDEVLARCSANHRGDVRRRLRRLRERGDLVLHVYSPAEADDAVRHFGERCWPHWVAAQRQLRSALPDRPGFRAYCDRLLREGVASGLAHYAALRVDGVEIAWHLGLSDRGRLYWWLPAHDAEWSEWSPGKVTLALLIDHAIGAGLREIHFQTGTQPYKLAWHPDMPPRVAVGWRSPSWRGRVFGAYDALSDVLHR